MPISHSKAQKELNGRATHQPTLAPEANDYSEFRKLAEITPNLVWRWSVGGGELYVNRRWRAYFGSEPEGLAPEYWSHLVDPDDLPLLERQHSDGPSKPAELRLRRHDGEYRWFSVRLIGLLSNDGELLHWIGNAADIDNLKEAERESRENAVRFRSMISAMAEGVMFFDATGCVALTNPSAERILGLSSPEMVGRTTDDPVWHTTHEDGSPFPGPEHPSMTTLRSGEPRIGVIMGIHKPGRPETWISINSEPLWEAGETSPSGVVTTFVDVTGQRLAQRDLAKSEKLFRALVENQGEGVAIVDSERLFQFLNPAAGRIFGVDPDRLLGTELAGFLSGSRDERHEYETSITRALDGSRRTLAVSANRNVLVFRDITERKRADEALLRANENLRQFAYAAAHDLQEPLRNIANALGLLKELSAPQLECSALELIDGTIQNAVRLRGMVEGLLAFTRIGEEWRTPALVDANRVLGRAMENLRCRVEESGGEVIADALPHICMQETHLLQLLQNLIGNALKYRRPGIPPQVEISASQQGVEWLFEVKDNGIGFDPAFADRIFGVFKRLHQQDEYEGTGIGLAICRQIAKSYGGRIWASGEPNIGAAFFFTVPASTADCERAAR